MKTRYLQALGVYGYEAVEPIVLAALVTEDPLLLIGKAGTGKTYLLNSLSEALNLEHRHYNASLISFDDLVGFPYPDAENGGVKFLETPATVWGAESVLIDEISRCKPEHQNRLFALVHERKVQGIPLPNLRYRWAAMNPCTTDQGSLEDYAGSEPLDPALADRFSLFIWSGDWEDLSDDERSKVAAPDGEGRVFVRHTPQGVRHEQMAGNLAHNGEHRHVTDAVGSELHVLGVAVPTPDEHSLHCSCRTWLHNELLSYVIGAT